MRETAMKIVTVLALALTLVACGSDEAAEAEPSVEAAPTVGKEIADNYNRALDKARDVENQVMEQRRKIDEALNDAEADPNRD